MNRGGRSESDFEYLVVHATTECNHRHENVCTECAVDWHRENYEYPRPPGTRLPARADRKV